MIRQILLLITVTSTLKADIVSFQFNNDVFAQTDRHYTYGLSLSWLDETVNENNNSSNGFSMIIKNIFDTVTFNTTDRFTKNYTAGTSFNQFAITPHNTDTSLPQYQDVPYAGFTSMSLFYFVWDAESFNEYRLDLGVAGKYSGTEYSQNIFHKIIGNKVSNGWDNQLKSELTANVLFRHGFKSYEDKIGKYDVDWFNQFGFQAGNLCTDIFAGTTFRIGKNYTSNFNVQYPYLKQDASLLQSTKPNDNFGYSLSFGANGSLNAYSYFLDEAIKSGYDMDNKRANYSLYSGIDLYFSNKKLTFFYQTQSQYTVHNNIDVFGGFKFSYYF